jgi:hypothetical protein
MRLVGYSRCTAPPLSEGGGGEGHTSVCRNTCSIIFREGRRTGPPWRHGRSHLDETHGVSD